MSATFDKEALIDRVDGDSEFIVESVELLDEAGPPLLTEIRAAAEAGDLDGVARAAHAFKGLVSNFCADLAAGAALRVEKIGREGRPDELADAVATLEAEADRLMQSLQAFATELRA